MSVNGSKATVWFTGCVNGYGGVHVRDCHAAGTLGLPV